MKKYAIWNKQTPIITPTGTVLSAEEWIEKRPVAGLDSVIVVCSAGEINGAFFGTLGQMVQMAEQQGAVIDPALTPEEKLAAIEAFEEQREAEAQAAAQAQAEQEQANANATASALTTLAANSDFQTMMMLPDEEVQ